MKRWSRIIDTNFFAALFIVAELVVGILVVIFFLKSQGWL